MATEAVLQARLDKLDKMIGSGVLSSSYQGSSMTFRSMEEMKTARAHTFRQLRRVQGYTPIKQVRIYATRGL